MTERGDDFEATRDTVRRDMGGADKVAALAGAGRRTARGFIAEFFDDGSFVELGTFAGMHTGEPTTVAGDGRITGHAALDGAPVGVIVDDVTVKRASSTALNARKADRVVDLARRAGMPVLVVGAAGGARLPETLRGDVFASEPIYPWLFDADRPPLVTAIVGESYGGSSFIAAMADVCVMTKGSVLAITSPRVVSMATSQQVTAEELGGADVLAAKTDLLDVVVDGDAELDHTLRTVLGFFTQPELAGERPAPVDLRTIVPADHAKVYDIRGVIDAVVDVDSFLELGAARGKSVITGLARANGRVIGIVASQPRHEAGALSPTACEKAARLTRLCDRFGFPIVSLVDTPGFQVGVHVEHSGMLRTAMELIAVNTSASVPVVTVVLRKAFGLAFFAMFSPDHGGDVVLAWPTAQIGFMAPATAANVLFDDPGRTEELGASASALDVAAAMGIDEVVAEAETVDAICRALAVLDTRHNRAP